MEITVLKATDHEVKLEIKGETHTLLNALQKALLRRPGVEFAGYAVPHPLLDTAVLRVKVKGGEKPLTAIVNAAKEVAEESESFRKLFEKTLKEFEKDSQR